MNIAPNMEVRVVKIADLREQDVNAHTMSPRVYDRLVANIKQRGQLESLPYCAQPNGEGKVEIVSGHHRVRAAGAAGLDEIPVIVDTGPMTRSQVVAKQLAHNALVGTDDPDVLKQLLGFIDDPDDLLTTGLPDDMLPGPGSEPLDLFAPRVDFEWRTISFTVLPHQEERMKELCDRLKDAHDLVLATQREQFDAFVQAAASYGRLKDIRSGGAVVAALTDVAVDAERAAADEPLLDDDEEGAGNWRSIERVIGSKAIPTEAAKTIERAIKLMAKRGDVGDKNRWQALEYMAAEWLAANA